MVMICFSSGREEKSISLYFLNITCDRKSKEKKSVSVSNSEVKAELVIAWE